MTATVSTGEKTAMRFFSLLLVAGLVLVALTTASPAVEETATAVPIEELIEEVQRLSRSLGPEHPDTLIARNNLAIAYDGLGDYAKAKEIKEQVLKVLVRVLGPEHPNTLAIHNNLAFTYLNLGDYAKAKELFEQVLKVLERVLGPEHPDTLIARNNLATTHINLGNNAKAKKLLEQLLKVQERILGSEHPDTMTTRQNLASTYNNLGDYAKAKELDEQLLATGERVHGTEHPNTLAIRHNMASTYLNLGDYAKAKELFEQVLKIQERILGPEHPDTLDTRHNLASVYNNLGDYAKAKEQGEQVLEIRNRVLGSEHPNTLTTRNNLAFAYGSLGNYAKAKDLYKQLLEIRERALGSEHPDTLITRNNLASAYHNLGDYAKAKDQYEQVLEIRNRLLGSEHPNTLITRNNLASVYDNLGDYAKAKDQYEQVLEIQNRLLGLEHPDTLAVCNNLALTYGGLGDYAKAKELYEQVLGIQMRVLGPEHPDTLTTRSNLASAYSKLGDYVKTKALEEQIQEIRERILGPEHPATLLALNNLAVTYFALGEDQQALDFYSRVFVGNSKTLGFYHPHTTQTAMNMAFAFKKTPRQLESAIFYARMAVEATQRQRHSQKSLERELQASYLAMVEDRYQNLAAWLIEAGRPEEALEVLRLLKQDELSEMIRGPTEGKTEAQTAPADPLQARLAELGAQLTEADAALEELHKKEKAGSPVPDKAGAETKLANARKAFQAFMEQLPDLLTRSDRVNPYQEAARRNLEALKALARNLGPAVVIIHSLSAPNALHIFLTTPEGLVLRQSKVGSKELETKVAALQPLLRSPGLDPRPLAQEIHDLLLGPLADDLAEAKTLMFSVDGALRYIPLAAQYDGRQWLAEKFAVVMFTEAARDRLKPQINLVVQAAALGLTEAKDGLAALPAVKEEVHDVVKLKGQKTGVLPGVIFLDDTFNYSSLAASLKEGRQVLHLASHFVFRPAAPNQSYLLLGDGSRLTLSDINQDTNLPFSRVDLMTLSACDTATGLAKGNGREVEGLAALAQKRGASSVLATLWPIADASTGRLMADFYRLRYEEKLSKAEALRRAQLNLMQGRLTAKEGQTETRDAKVPSVSPLVKEKIAPAQRWTEKYYAHPYYWAPFILMGNWR